MCNLANLPKRSCANIPTAQPQASRRQDVPHRSLSVPNTAKLSSDLGLHGIGMNSETVGLTIFALIALSAVFAFILVLGGPESTGQLSGEQKIGTSWYKVEDAWGSCAKGSFCNDGMPAVPTGNFDTRRGLYECKCQTKSPSWTFWRSPYSPG